LIICILREWCSRRRALRRGGANGEGIRENK
jgi:hypothetical protein